MWRLQCQCMNYEWGKRGSASAVAELKVRTFSSHRPNDGCHDRSAHPTPVSLQRKSDGSTVDEAKPYAEFW